MKISILINSDTTTCCQNHVKLLKDVFAYLPQKAGNIIYSCATHHNFLTVNKFRMMRDIDDDMLRIVINLERNDNFIQYRQQAKNVLGE